MTQTPEAVGFAEFVWIWNRWQGNTTPAHHRNIARWLEQGAHGPARRLLLLAFRNCGKSTLLGLFAVWLLVRDPSLRILILSADHALACKMARNARRVLERHPLARHLRPRHPDQWALDRFTVNRTGELRDPSVLARGIAANITGSRADVVICDDVEVPRTSDTAAKRALLRERLIEIGFVIVPGGLQVVIGTPHTKESIYAAAADGSAVPAFLDGFIRFELPLVDADGRSAWPERFPPAEIDAIRARSGPLQFSSQMLLRPPAAAESRLDASRLIEYDDEFEHSEANGRARARIGAVDLVSASCWWDPGFGSERGGDGSVIAAVFTDKAGFYRLHRIRYLGGNVNRQGDVASAMCAEVARFVESLHLPSVTVETNGIGRFLPGLLRSQLARLGVAAAVREHASHQPKAARILAAFDAPLAAGRLLAHASVLETPFADELGQWSPEAKCPDDGLDAVAGCLLSEPVRLPRFTPPARGADWRPGAQPQTASGQFEP